MLEVITRSRRRTGGAPAISVAMRGLGGAKLWVRPGTSDLRNASYYYSSDLYLPPPRFDRPDLRQVLEIGSNMGAALTALGHRYPDARILGVEPDPGNVAVAQKNVARYGDRASVVQAGIWDADTDLVVERTSVHGEHGFTVRSREESDGADAVVISARTIDTILAEHMPDGEIDYMHVTIEGTERRVFAAGGDWVNRIRSIRVEAHPAFHYPAAECIAQLEALGYDAWPDPSFPHKWVFAERPLSQGA